MCGFKGHAPSWFLRACVAEMLPAYLAWLSALPAHTDKEKERKKKERKREKNKRARFVCLPCEHPKKKHALCKREDETVTCE